MMLRESIREAVAKAVQELLGNQELPSFSIEVPEDEKHGDYATNVALVLAKQLKKNPMDLAKELAAKLTDERWSIEVAPPGFVNFKLADGFLLKEGSQALEHLDEWGKNNSGEGKTVIVEYFQLNIAKQPHIGHLRSAVIGDSLKRLLSAWGYKAISDTHVGDWGTQFGILLYEYKKLSSKEQQLAISDLATSARVYAEASAHVFDDKKERELAKEEFAKLERGDPENRKIWKDLVATSMKNLEETAKRLELKKFDEHLGESFYEDKMKPIMDKALQKGVAKKLADGAVIVDLTRDKLDEAVLIKSDGASTYLLRDLATIQYRRNQWNFWKNLYVVDVRQAHHFKQVFRVAELLGFEGTGASEHIEFGFMKLPEGMLSTRKGNIILLEAVLDEAVKRAEVIIKEKNPELKDSEEVAKMVGLGAIKYFDLSHNRKSDVVFDWEKALSFEGNTGPYIQYTHARLSSILRKVGSQGSLLESQNLERGEQALLVEVLRFPEAIQDSLESWSPHILAGYLYNLASKANEFYHAYPVMQEEYEQKKQTRLALVKLTAGTLKNGLNLLGIEAPEEM